MILCGFLEISSIFYSYLSNTTLLFDSQKSSSFRSSKRSSPKKMDRLRKSFRDSFRRRKDRVPEASKPHQWQADEAAVRSATCVFSVKYLGCVEVFESRGMQVCEEAIKVLRVSNANLFHHSSNFITFSFLLEFTSTANSWSIAREW